MHGHSAAVAGMPLAVEGVGLDGGVHRLGLAACQDTWPVVVASPTADGGGGGGGGGGGEMVV